jgi:hypothetical protein
MQPLLESRSPDALSIHLSLAGLAVRLIGEPASLYPSSEALAHLETPAKTPDLTIEVRPNLPDLSLEHGWLRIRPDVPEWVQWLEPSRGLGAVAYSLPLKTHEQAAPFLPLIKTFLQHRGITMLHAGAVALNESGLLLIGRGGSGKSTTSLLCLEAGWDFLADDYCAFFEQTVYSLYSSAKIHLKDAARVNFLHLRQNPDPEKGYTMLFPRFQNQLRGAAPIRALVLPSVGGELGFEPISPQTALLALAPSTLLQLRDSAEVLGKLANLARGLPCFRLHLGNHPKAIPAMLQRLLEGL